MMFLQVRWPNQQCQSKRECPYQCMGDIVAVTLGDAEVKQILMRVDGVGQSPSESDAACVQIHTECIPSHFIVGRHTELQRQGLKRLGFKMQHSAHRRTAFLTTQDDNDHAACTVIVLVNCSNWNRQLRQCRDAVKVWELRDIQQSLYCKLSAECVGKRMVKIGQYLAKIRTMPKWEVFSDKV